jgi:hypothetical protein
VLDVLTPPYAPACGRDCTYYREVLPPQLLGDDARPLAVAADQVTTWVRWQQQQHQQQGQAAPCDASAAAAHPWQAYGAAQGGERAGLVVGLEAVPMPSDFVVERGVYAGRGARA